jgi:NAD(P) transhydrogenase
MPPVSQGNVMTDELKTYDLVVGGGPAGISGATAALSLGKTVTLVDDHLDIGGAAVNTGTVPSKTLRETALGLSGFKSRNLYGGDLSLRREVTVPDFLGHQEHVKDAFHASLTQRLEGGRGRCDRRGIRVHVPRPRCRGPYH